jgi:hypothetical protein
MTELVYNRMHVPFVSDMTLLDYAAIHAPEPDKRI